jgi:methylated-DNA-[protein]-cysteine S-methyltransferase
MSTHAPSSPRSQLHWIAQDSPLGALRLIGDAHGLQAILFPAQPLPANARACAIEGAPEALRCAALQLGEYFNGHRTRFELPLSPQGTSFQRQVWTALAAIPFGQTRSYAQVARSIGRPTASRAVGAANGRNPLPIVVPCHRVIGANGSLTGFAGGLEAKRLLLRLENAA